MNTNIKFGFLFNTLGLIGFAFFISASMALEQSSKPRPSDSNLPIKQKNHTTYTPVIVTPSSNVVYQYLDNQIRFSLEPFHPDSIILELEPDYAGALTKTGPGVYSLKISRIPYEKLSLNSSVILPSGEKKPVGFMYLNVLPIPKPEASLKGNSGPTISSETLKEITKVDAGINGFIYNIDFEVTQYDYIYKPTRGNLIKGTIKGQYIPDVLKAAFDGSALGDLLIISGIEAKCQLAPPVSVSGSLVYSVR